MSRRSAPDYEMVFRSLLDVVGPIPNLNRIMLDFEAATWVAIRNLIANGDFNEHLKIVGCHFHYTQCIVRKIKRIDGLISQYNRNGSVNLFCRKIMALSLVPSSRIVEAFEYLQSLLNRMAVEDTVLQGKLQVLLNYVHNTWIDGPMFKHTDWCTYRLIVRTNNHLEGSHHRYNQRMGSSKPTFASLIEMLHEEAKTVKHIINQVYMGTSSTKQTKKAADRNSELEDIWSRYETGVIVDVTELLEELTKGLEGPNENLVNFHADPDYIDHPQV